MSNAQQALDTLVRATVANTGDDFFAQLTQELNALLGGAWTFVGELVPGSDDRIRMVSSYLDGAHIEGFEYGLEDTPCQRVVGGTACYWATGVADAFPNDAGLAKRGIESYLGIPLTDPELGPLGHIAVMGRGPLAESAQAHDVFHVLASRTAAELRRRRAERERAEIAAAFERSRRLEALGTMAAGVAHDIRNLLAVARAHLDVALLEGGAPPEVERRIHRSIAEIERGGDFINRVMRIGKPVEVRREPVDLPELLSEIAQALRTDLPPTIRVVDRAQVATASFDRVLLYDALLNLGRNAAQAIGDKVGAIELFVQPAEPTPAEIATGVTAGVPCVLLGVRDTGCGMDQATCDRLFEPFFTTKPVGEGTGLGLTMVQSAVRSHGGCVRVRSAPGKGSTVALLLPDLGS